ncbi:MAG: SH3 domain-containing protein [Gemmatimonadales bacterium]
MLAALCLLLGRPIQVRAQDAYSVVRTDNFRQRPDLGSPVLATVQANTVLEAGGREGGWIQVTLDGWIWALSIARVNDSVFDLTVSATGGENFRTGPNGRLLARLSEGTLLNEVERSGNWVHVTRTGWMRGESLNRSTAASLRRATSGTSVNPDTVTASLDLAVTVDSTLVRTTPDGDDVGILEAQTPVRIIARSGDWVQVQIDGWVREGELRPAEGGPLVGVSGAQVRARPEDYEGGLVQWKVQFISLQTADELRREIPTGARFMLARGPIPEQGFLYVLLLSEQVEAVQALQPLTELLIIGRIRTGRSEYLGNPILELVDMVRSED